MFVPNNSAFIDLPVGTLAGLPKDKARLKAVLSHHAVEGAIMYTEIVEKPSLVAIDQKALAVDAKELLKVSGVTIIRGNVKCRNDYIQVVDKVMVP